ncbi:DUF262 domain-containing protein [Brevibacillus sp. NPDC058079]|uniref:DUF262 domain-containing protein n=1 Tax=Brevibacillus sp. NPDC058079 TaxID=3346330 RepID=UPI0036E97FA3
MTQEMMTVNGMTKEEDIRPILKATTEMELSHFEIPISTDTRSVAQFMSMLKLFKFNDPIQRNADAWTIHGKSLLMISVIEGISIGHIKVQVIRKSQMKYRNVLDGKQRLTTIRDFVNGKFAIECDRYVSGFDEEGNLIWININGMYFNDLPQKYKDKIMGTIITIEEYDINDEMKFELFQRWNNGVALKPSQLRKAKMSYELLSLLAELKQLVVFTTGFSPNAINNDQHADMILKAMAVMVTDNNTALDNKSLNKMLDENVFVSGILEETKEIADYLMNVHPLLDEKAQTKSYGQSKTVSLFYMARLAKREGRSFEEFAGWVTQFFVKDYAKSGFGSQSGTAKLESVRKRNEIILKHYLKHFQVSA